jgi:4-hydroxy-tetrahydrodipicolinate synthase
MLSTQKDPGGLYCYLATPYDDSGSVAFDVLAEYVDQIIRAGVTGVTCLASTCEGPYLTAQERTDVLKVVCEVARGRAAINAGVGAVSTREVVERAQLAEKLGATSLMLEMQQYFPVSFDAAYQHYATVADACSLPIRLYNLPFPTGFDFTPERILNMSAISRILSVKEASHEVNRLKEIRLLCGDRYTLYCGFHYQALDGFRLGAQGWEVMMHPLIAPALVGLYRALSEDPWSDDAAQRFQSLATLFQFFKQFGVPQSIKAISKRTTLKFGEVRHPLPVLPKHAESRLEAIMDALPLEATVV